MNIEIFLDPLFLLHSFKDIRKGNGAGTIRLKLAFVLYIYIYFGVPFPRFKWGVLNLYTRYGS